MHEHWRLILEGGELNTISPETFLNGDFKSVSLNKTATRLAHFGAAIPGKEGRKAKESTAYTCFETLRLHRHKLVHFHTIVDEERIEHATTSLV